MCIAADRGASFVGPLFRGDRLGWFGERLAMYVVESPVSVDGVMGKLCDGVPIEGLGITEGRIDSELPSIKMLLDKSRKQVVALSDLRACWQSPLDW